MREQFSRNNRARIQACLTARDQLAPTHGNEIGGAGTCTDEMHGHDGTSAEARAQVAGPTATRAAMSRAVGPAAASAAASATEGTPVSAITRCERVCVRLPTAARSSCDTSTKGTPKDDAAAARPGSAPLAADVAILAIEERSRPACRSADAIASAISLADV